jgi:hypothetical protein
MYFELMRIELFVELVDELLLLLDGLLEKHFLLILGEFSIFFAFLFDLLELLGEAILLHGLPFFEQFNIAVYPLQFELLQCIF